MRLSAELLEDRVTPSAGLREQYMLELVNRMRENPAAELPLLLNSGDADVNAALSYFNVNRSVLQTQWNSLVPAPALAWNDNLASAATNHNALMLATGVQAHQLPGEPDLGTRATNAGYANWNYLGENIFAYADSVFQAHAAFAIDWGSTSTGIQNPPGHRQNIMDPGFRDLGIGILDNPTGFNNVGPLLITQDFGNRFSYGNPFVVGVVYSDANSNGYFDQNEGLAGATLTISGPGGTSTAFTTQYGGYQVKLAPGVYTITASGGGLAAPIAKNVTIGSSNVHLNFINGTQPRLNASLPFSDDFNRANSSFIGAYWNAVQGNFSVANNALAASNPGLSIATLNGVAAADVAVQADVSIAANLGAGLIARYSANGSYYLGMIQADASGSGYTPYIFEFVAGKGFVQLNKSAATIASGAGILRFEVVGSSLKLFYGDDAAHLSLVAYATDSALSAGTTGLRAVQGIGFDNFSTTDIALTTATPPFLDTFTLADGSQLSRNWTERQGNFGVTGAALRGNDPAPSIAIVNGISLSDAAVQADVAIGANQGAGLIGRYQADGSYYLGMIQSDTAGTSFTPYFFKYVVGFGFAQVGSAGPTFVAGPGTLRFEVVGSSLKLFFGPDAAHLGLIASRFDSTLAGAGLTGIRAVQGVTLDNVAVNAITLTSPSAPFADAFAQSDGSQLGRNWTERQGNFTVVSGTLRGNDPAPSIATVNGIVLADVAVQADIAIGGNQGAGLIARLADDGSYYLGMIQPDAAGTTFTPYIFRYTAGKGFTLVADGPSIAAAPGTLRFEVVGSSLKLFFCPNAGNLALVAYGFDVALAGAGAAGIRAVQGASLDNVAVNLVTLTAPTAPFTDAFAQTDGSQLSRNWTERQGNFGIAGGALRGNDAAPSIATVNGINRADVTVQADVTTSTNQGAGLVSRYQADGSYYLAMIQPDATGTTVTPYLFANIAGKGFVLLAAGPDIAASSGTLRFQVVGSSLQLFFGADAGHLSLVASAIDASLSGPGLAGIRAVRGVSFDNFMIG